MIWHWDSNRGTIRHIPLFRATDRFWGMEHVSSRLSTPNHENYLHHDPPKGQTEGLIRSTWGVEAISHKITAENHILRQMSDFGPILDEEVAFSCTSTSNHENHLHHDPPTDPKKGLSRSTWGVVAISHKITAENHILRQMSDFRPILTKKSRSLTPARQIAKITYTAIYLWIQRKD